MADKCDWSLFDNVFVGYQAGYNETGSNKLYIDNSNTSTPLIHGDFDTDKVTINGNMTVTGSLRANTFTDNDGNSLMAKNVETGEITLTTTTIQDTSGSKYVRKDRDTGSVHIGENSVVFDDASGSIGNGSDIMSSSVGKLQIGKKETDSTTFVGEVNVRNPKNSSNAANKKYVDTLGALSMAMSSATKTNNGDGSYIGLGTAVVEGEGAVAAGYSYQKEDKFINISLSYHRLMSNPVISSGIGWKF